MICDSLLIKVEYNECVVPLVIKALLCMTFYGSHTKVVLPRDDDPKTIPPKKDWITSNILTYIFSIGSCFNDFH